MDALSTLKRHRALARLGTEGLDELARAATVRRLRRGETLWRAGEAAVPFTVVGHGLVKVVLPGSGVRDLVIGLSGPGESVGDAAMLVGGPLSSDASALTDPVVIARVPREIFFGVLERNGAAALDLARDCANQARLAQRRLVLFASSAEERLATTLMELSERFGDEMEDGTTLIPLRLTRAELAALVGTTVEATIRTLSRWSREGLLTTVDGGIAVHDPAALKRRGGGNG
jgi:CRP-like cAMP-binding protein